MVSFFRGFSDEEELEQWYSEQKEILDAQFSSAIEGKEDKVAGAREKYHADLKKLVLKYQAEYAKLIPKILKRK